jgi:hypothetical protein
MGEPDPNMTMEHCAMVGPRPPPKPPVPPSEVFLKRLVAARDMYVKARGGAHAKHAVVVDMEKEYREKFGPLPATYRSPPAMSGGGGGRIEEGGDEDAAVETPEAFLKRHPELAMHAGEVERGKTVDAVVKLMKLHPRFKVADTGVRDEFRAVFEAAERRKTKAKGTKPRGGKASEPDRPASPMGGGLLAELQAQKKKSKKKKEKGRGKKKKKQNPMALKLEAALAGKR